MLVHKLTICGTEYIVPELKWEHAEIIEEQSGGPVHALLAPERGMRSARTFIQIVTGTNKAAAQELLTQHITEKGYKALGEIVDAFIQALEDSDFFRELLGLAKPETVAEPVEQTETAPGEI